MANVFHPANSAAMENPPIPSNRLICIIILSRLIFFFNREAKVKTFSDTKNKKALTIIKLSNLLNIKNITLKHPAKCDIHHKNIKLSNVKKFNYKSISCMIHRKYSITGPIYSIKMIFSIEILPT